MIVSISRWLQRSEALAISQDFVGSEYGSSVPQSRLVISSCHVFAISRYVNAALAIPALLGRPPAQAQARSARVAQDDSSTYIDDCRHAMRFMSGAILGLIRYAPRDDKRLIDGCHTFIFSRGRIIISRDYPLISLPALWPGPMICKHLSRRDGRRGKRRSGRISRAPTARH